jgi:GTPase SAR1 family protein
MRNAPLSSLPDPAEVSALVEQAVQLPALAPHRGRLQRLVADYARTHSLQDRPLVFALVGATGAGKSSLLNALAGQKLAVEGEDRPTSRRATVFAPEGTAVAGIEGAELRRYSLAGGAPWAGQVFIDTPDLNSIAREHQAVARAALESADVAIAVMHRGSVAEAVQADFLAEFAARRRLVLVINHADLLGEAARTELKAQARKLLGTLATAPATESPQHREVPTSPVSLDDLPVFAVSAKKAQALDNAGHEFLALVEALRAMSARAAAEELRAGTAAAVLAELRQLTSAALAITEGALEEIGKELVNGLESARAELIADFTARLDSEGTLAADARRQASVRGWGPWAWGMRLSLLGASGMGTAALIGRAHLPTGLAVAAASAALSRVQEHTRARAAEARIVAAAEDSTIDTAARAALSGARAAAGRKGLDAAQLGLPDHAELLDALREGRAAAWRYTRERAVPEAVNRWWSVARWLLLPLVNLPMLALFGHVAYRVINAYLHPPYLGVDFFLNALALAGVVTGAGSLLASISLLGVTRVARTAGREKFEGALAALEAELTDQGRAALEGPREAARKLARG